MINKTCIRDLKSQQEYEKMKYYLEKQFYQFDMKNQFSELIFLCIGTNKVIGDMVGPIVGERLKNEVNNRKIKKIVKKEILVYGNMKHTLNLKNADKVIQHVQNEYQKPFLITIDTALGKEDMIEKIFIGSGEIEIGKALEKGVKYQSNIYIKGVVGKYGTTVEENMNTLKNADIVSIKRISNIICDGIIDSMKKYHKFV